MKNTVKKSWQALIPAVMLLAVLLTVQSGFSSSSAKDITCPAPGNVTVTDKTSNSISFAWDSVSGASTYKVWYVRQADNYTSPEVTTGNSFISFSNLPPGSYTFYFASVCAGEVSQSIIIDDIMMG